MKIQYNKIGEVLSGKYCGKFCKIECLNQDDFLITYLDKNKEENVLVLPISDEY